MCAKGESKKGVCACVRQELRCETHQDWGMPDVVWAFEHGGDRADSALARTSTGSPDTQAKAEVGTLTTRVLALTPPSASSE